MVVVRTQNFLSPAPRGKSAKESKAAMVLQHQATSAAALLHGQLRINNGRKNETKFTKNEEVVVAARGSGMRGSGTNAKFSKFSRAW